jgi:ABC-type multidrug transport system permease subunit
MLFFLYIFFILMVILDILKYKGKKFKNYLKKFNTYRKKFIHILFIIIDIYIY